MGLGQKFLNVSGYGIPTEAPDYIRMYPASEPETCFGPARLFELFRYAGSLLYAHGVPQGRDHPGLAERARIHVDTWNDPEFDVEVRFARPDGRIELCFEDGTTVVLSSLAWESRERDNLILRTGVTFGGVRGSSFLTGPLLGAGGTAVVHEVKNQAGAHFAAKCLSPGRFDLEEMVDRFEREVEHLREARHPNVIEYVDEAYEGENLILVMERAKETLAFRLEQGASDLQTMVSWMEEALAGLAYLHQLGLVHRDISPKNIMFAEDGVLKLSDFGTVRADTDPDLTVDVSNVRLGSLIYISEDQRREPHGAQPADDVFSLGQVAYLMLSGIAPQGNPPPLNSFPQIPAELQLVVEKMRSYRRGDRFTNGGEALEALRSAIACIGWKPKI